jgi:hypothetical protein
VPEKFYGRNFNIRLREEKISMSEMQRQETQAASIGFSDRNLKKKLTAAAGLS